MPCLLWCPAARSHSHLLLNLHLQVEFTNLSKSYLQGLNSQSDAFNFASKKKLKNGASSKLLVWARVQILRFTRNGTMKEDMDNNVVNECVCLRLTMHSCKFITAFPVFHVQGSHKRGWRARV